MVIASIWPIIQVLIGRAALAGEPITVINLDGRPAKVGEARFRTSAQNDVKWKSDYRAFLSTLAEMVASIRAQEAEADSLAALQLMARSSDRGGTVAMIDSGVQTVEPLNFLRPNLWVAEPVHLADQLEQTRQLPDLLHRVVALVGLGDTAAPQPPVGISGYANLFDIWRAAVDRAGASCVEPVTRPSSGDPLADVPPVSVVPVPEPIRIPLICPGDPLDQCSLPE